MLFVCCVIEVRLYFIYCRRLSIFITEAERVFTGQMTQPTVSKHWMEHTHTKQIERNTTMHL